MDITLDKALEIVGRPELKKVATDKPYGSREATVKSFIAATIKEASTESVQTAHDMAVFWNVAGECDAAARKLAEYTPTELQPEDYALFRKEAGVQLFAAYDCASTVEAAEVFAQQRSNLPLEMRKQAAISLLERARRFEATLPAYAETALHKSAGFGFASPDSVENAMITRLNAIKANDALGAKLASALTNLVDNPQLCFDTDLVKCAVSTLEEFDVEAGLTAKYASGISLPEEIIDSRYTTEKFDKVASAKLAVELVNGETVEVDQLPKEALEAVDPKLASMDSVTLVDVLPTLPKGDADLLTRLS